MRPWLVILKHLVGAALVVSCGGSGGAATVTAAQSGAAPPPELPRAVEEASKDLDAPASGEVSPSRSSEAASKELSATPEDATVTASGRGHADLDPSNDDVVGPPEPLPDCEARLEAAGVRFKPARIGVGKKRDGVYTCGAKQVVRYRGGPGKIGYSSSPLLTCTMALAMADFEEIVQEEAERVLGSRVAKIEHLGTYNCREMALYDLISEHSFANGIDLRRFHLENGRTIDVLEDFRPGESAPTDAETLFLRGLANRLYDENVFSVVVTPFFDRAHRNHIHVDLARYRVDGSRP